MSNRIEGVRSRGLTKAESKALPPLLDRHVAKYSGTVWISTVGMEQGWNGMLGWEWDFGIIDKKSKVVGGRI